MKDLAIIFLYHLPIDTGVTASNLAAIREYAPDADVFCLSFDTLDLGGALDVRNEGVRRWNPDLLVYYWFARERRDYRRFLVVEYDTLFTCHPRDFFGHTYDLNVVGSVVMDPHLTGPAVQGYANHHETWTCWPPGMDNRDMRGLSPVFGLFSHRALSAMVDLFFATPWMPKLVAECRLGTLAYMAGYALHSFARTPGEACRYIAPSYDSLTRCPQGPGLWHPVK